MLLLVLQAKVEAPRTVPSTVLAAFEVSSLNRAPSVAPQIDFNPVTPLQAVFCLLALRLRDSAPWAFLVFVRINETYRRLLR